MNVVGVTVRFTRSRRLISRKAAPNPVHQRTSRSSLDLLQDLKSRLRSRHRSTTTASPISADFYLKATRYVLGIQSPRMLTAISSIGMASPISRNTRTLNWHLSKKFGSLAMRMESSQPKQSLSSSVCLDHPLLVINSLLDMDRRVFVPKNGPASTCLLPNLECNLIPLSILMLSRLV